MEADNVCTVFEFTEKQTNKFLIRHTPAPEGICLDDIDKTERILEDDNLSICYAGKILKPLQTSKGLIFIDCKYLAPLADIANIMELFERTMSGGTTYIAAKVGLLLYAVIFPYDPLTEEFVTQTEKLSRQCRVAFDKKEASKNRIVIDEDPKQQVFTSDGKRVDTDSGEILENTDSE